MKNSKSATSTVTGIIDGTGAIGVSFGQFLLARTQKAYGWTWGFLFIVTISIGLTLVPLSPVLYRDIKDIIEIKKKAKMDKQTAEMMLDKPS